MDYEKRCAILENFDRSEDWPTFLGKCGRAYEEYEEMRRSRQYDRATKKLHALLPDYVKVFTIINDKYRDAKLLPDYRSRRYDIGIFLVGFSIMPVILSILEIQPEKVIFVPSRDTESLVNSVVDAIKVVAPSYHKTVFGSATEKEIIENYSDPADVFKKIDKLIEKYGDKSLAIDITGGKKTMIAGAFMASASSKNCHIYYIDFEEYNETIGLPVPCTEFLAKLPNPSEIFSLADWERIESLFNSYQFRQAIADLAEIEKMVQKNEIYFDKTIKKKITNIARYAQAFECWDDYRYSEAAVHLPENDALKKLKVLDEKYEEAYRCLTKRKPQIKPWALKGMAIDKLEKDIYDDPGLFAYYITDRFVNAERRMQQGQLQGAFIRFITLAEFVLTLWAEKNTDRYCLNGLVNEYGNIPFKKLLRWLSEQTPDFLIGRTDSKALLSLAGDRNRHVLIHSTSTVGVEIVRSASGLAQKVIQNVLKEMNFTTESFENIKATLSFSRLCDITKLDSL